MIEDISEQYVGELCKYLRPLPVAVRLSAVRQVAGYIDAYRAAGRAWPDIAAQLGDAHTVARAYLADYYAEARSASLLRCAGFAAGTGLASLIAVPSLALLTLLFALAAIVAPLAAIFGAGWDTPANAFDLPTLFAAGLLCAMLAAAAYRLLRSYTARVLMRYRMLAARLTG